MKVSTLLITAFTLLSIHAHAADPSIGMSGADYVPLLDQPARTCASQIKDWNNKEDLNLPGITALMGTVRLYWEGPSALYLDSMIISFTGADIPGGRQDVVINGEELGFLWSGDAVVPSFPAFEGRAVTPFCRFRVGNLKVNDKYKYFEGIGIIRVTGRYQEKGEWKTITGGDLTFRYHMSPMPRPRN